MEIVSILYTQCSETLVAVVTCIMIGCPISRGGRIGLEFWGARSAFKALENDLFIVYTKSVDLFLIFYISTILFGCDGREKKRLTNFSQAEKFALTEIINNNKSVIENKKTDGITAKQKDSRWHNIAAEFNSAGISENRTVASLKNCWDNLKKKTRKHFADVRRERFATGGGTMEIKDDPVCDRVKGIIEPSVDGLINEFDSDALEVPYSGEQVSHIDDANEAEVEYCIETLDEGEQLDWTNWNPTLLRKKKSKELQTKEELTFADVDAVLSEKTIPATSQYTTQMRSNQKRKRPTSALNLARINSTPKVNAGTRNKHFTALALAKLELVEMMKTDMEAKKELELRILETQLEKECLEVQLLKKEIAIKDAQLKNLVPQYKDK